MPRGRGIDKQLQLMCCNAYEANQDLPEWSHPDDFESVRKLADRFGISKSTVHRYVNRDALNADRRRSQRRRDRLRRFGAVS